MIFKSYGLKNELVTLGSKFQSSILKRAWQAQFLSHKLEILGKSAFVEDVQNLWIQ